jgi:CheY-like chemotaxis protein
LRIARLFDVIRTNLAPRTDIVPTGGQSDQNLAKLVISSLSASPEATFDADNLILVVEDHPVLQELAVRQLHKLGLSADAVSSGKEALTLLSRNNYSLILMDCQMPTMDGFSATRTIRQNELGAGKHIPIVAMTAGAIKGDREKCLDAGMDDYLSKPVSQEQLRSMLEKWLPSKVKNAGESPVKSNQVSDMERGE